MDSDIKQVLLALKHWRKAYQNLKQAHPDPETAIAKFAVAQHNLNQLLQQQEIANQVEQLLHQGAQLATSDLEKILEDLRDRPCDIIAQEIEAARPLNLRHKDMTKVLAEALAQDNLNPDLHDYKTLLSHFPKLYAEIVQQLAEARALSRKPKKQRKRQITLGVIFTAIGIGLLVANTQGDVASSAYSYILGGNALFKAIRDLVGEVEQTPG
jgi:hypothetical protein